MKKILQQHQGSIELDIPNSLLELTNWFPVDLYLVGGLVRDLLLGLEGNGDYDLSSALPPETLKKVLPDDYKIIDTGIDHGTVTIITPDGFKYEHTTFRKDVICDGRRAAIEYADSIEEDIKRRDLSINTFALNLSRRKLVGGKHAKNDLLKGIIRMNGNPFIRIEEDYLRIIRAVRFAAKFNFKIDWLTEVAIRMKAKDISKYVSRERIRDEFEKSLPFIFKFVQHLDYLGIFNHIIDKRYYDNWLEYAMVDNKSINRMWCSLKPAYMTADKYQETFKLSNDTMRFIYEMQEVFPRLLDEEDSAVAYNLLNSMRMVGLNEADDYYGVKQQRLHYLRFLSRKVVGDDIVDKGIVPGPIVKTLIDECFRIQVKHPELTKEQILARIFKC